MKRNKINKHSSELFKMFSSGAYANKVIADKRFKKEKHKKDYRYDF